VFYLADGFQRVSVKVGSLEKLDDGILFRGEG
jgi:hypothetical protein